MPSNVVYGNRLIQSRKKQKLTALKGNQGMTLISPAYFVDDANYNVGDIGFNFPFYGINYRNDIYVGTNSYITMGFGSNAYSNLSATRPGRGILIAAADVGILGGIFISKDSLGENFRIRFEGTNRTPDTSKNMIWEATLYSSGNFQIATETITPYVTGNYSAITKGDGNKFTLFSNASNQRLTYTYDSATDNYTLI